VDENQEKADAISLKQFFDADKEVKSIGGSNYLTQLLSEATGAVDIRYYAKVVIDLWQRRELVYSLKQLEDKIANPSISFDEIRRELDINLEKLITDINGNEPKHIGALADEKMADILNGGNKDLIFTEFRETDKLLGGLNLGALLIIGARVSMGKSSYALNLAENIARKQSALFISLEMTGKELASKFMVKVASINPSRLRYGNLNQDEMQSLQKNSSQIQESKLFIDDAPKGITLKQLRPKLKRLINKHDIKVLIVDYLQLIKPEGKKENRTTDVSEIAEGLKGIAKEFNIVVVALAQLSRAVEQRDNKRPQLSDLRESGSIEAAADAVMFIYRAEYYLERLRPDEKFEPAEFSKWLQKMQEVKGKAEIIIAKNRNGVGAGTIQYSFDGEFSKFSELE
jgi:replicative DNA helicase